MNVPDFTVTSVLPGCVCQPVDEFGPNVKRATTVFVPGMAAKPAPFGIEPAPITSDTTDPVDPVARATLARAIDADDHRGAEDQPHASTSSESECAPS